MHVPNFYMITKSICSPSCVVLFSKQSFLLSIWTFFIALKLNLKLYFKSTCKCIFTNRIFIPYYVLCINFISFIRTPAPKLKCFSVLKVLVATWLQCKRAGCRLPCTQRANLGSCRLVSSMAVVWTHSVEEVWQPTFLHVLNHEHRSSILPKFKKIKKAWKFFDWKDIQTWKVLENELRSLKTLNWFPAVAQKS